MKQYKKLLEEIQEKGTHKDAAREGMPGTTSLFGYQFRHDLADGFPLLTTKRLTFRSIVAELLWFLRGDTNVKYLNDCGCTIWNQDAYNYYYKLCQRDKLVAYNFEAFEEILKGDKKVEITLPFGYVLGDCGMQYGKLWRDWTGTASPQILSLNMETLNAEQAQTFHDKWKEAVKNNSPVTINSTLEPKYINTSVDQIKELINGLIKNPLSRRHILTAWNPATLNDMALNACHALVQFNCRPMTLDQRIVASGISEKYLAELRENDLVWEYLDGGPTHYLDCQMYQRSADVFLGVPFNIASYALLTMILSQICNMVPGDFIHTFGDVHIYDDHQEQVALQLTREPMKLPELMISPRALRSIKNKDWEKDFDEWIQALTPSDFAMDGYDPHPAIKAKLSTGLK